ncbi:unnamed protein product [Parajaminaea phylloscopi]
MEAPRPTFTSLTPSKVGPSGLNMPPAPRLPLISLPLSSSPPSSWEHNFAVPDGHAMTRTRFSAPSRQGGDPWTPALQRPIGSSLSLCQSPRGSIDVDDFSDSVESWPSAKTGDSDTVTSPCGSFETVDFEFELDAATVATEMALQVLRSDFSASELYTGSSALDESGDEANWSLQTIRPEGPTGTRLSAFSAGAMSPVGDKALSDGCGIQLPRQDGLTESEVLSDIEPQMKRKGRARMSQEKRRRLARRKEREALISSGLDPAQFNVNIPPAKRHLYVRPCDTVRPIALGIVQNSLGLYLTDSVRQQSSTRQGYKMPPTPPSGHTAPVDTSPRQRGAVALNCTSSELRISEEHRAYPRAMDPPKPFSPVYPNTVPSRAHLPADIGIDAQKATPAYHLDWTPQPARARGQQSWQDSGDRALRHQSAENLPLIDCVDRTSAQAKAGYSTRGRASTPLTDSLTLPLVQAGSPGTALPRRSHWTGIELPATVSESHGRRGHSFWWQTLQSPGQRGF